jgi:hypothetical protein
MKVLFLKSQNVESVYAAAVPHHVEHVEGFTGMTLAAGSACISNKL